MLEEYPVIFNLVAPIISGVKIKESKELPKRYHGSFLKDEEADIHFIEGPFGSLFHQKIVDKDWTIGLLNLSVKELITVDLVTNQPLVTICCMLQGSASFELHGYGKLTLEKNRYGFYYIPSVDPMRISFDTDDYLAIYFSLSNEFVSEFINQHPRFLDLYDLQRNNAPHGKALQIFKVAIEERKVLDAVRNCNLKGTAKSIYLHARILDLLGCYFNSQETAETGRDQTSDQHIRLLESQSFIQLNYYLPLKIEALSRRAGINLRTYERTFKAIFEMGPREYIEQVRVRKAAELLETTDLPVTSIGHQVGFTGRNYFSFVFSKVYGCPPRAYRARRNRT